ncbi:glycosyltransferase family 4 protein [Flavobacterium sp.]|uniref:glycosyltransferase family 4 protein n=1 Tax=Flavobacterium sp. TaxID=239 RepID=UPI0038FC9D0E
MKKKICFIVSTPYTAKAFLESHFESLSKQYELYLVANLNDLELPNYSNQYLQEIKHIPICRKINLLEDLKALFLLTKYLRENKFDVIATFTPKAGLIGIISGKIAKTKHRIHFFTGQVWHTKKGFLKNFLILLDKLVVSLSTNILVDGLPQQEFLIQNNIIAKNNSLVLGKGTISGIDLVKFSPNDQVREELRKSLNYEENDIVFMFLGRLNRDKGIFDLVKAFDKLTEVYSNVKLLIVGPDEENVTEQLSQKSKDKYHIYGSTDCPEKTVQVCDVFCLPSHREAFGLSIIEASACQKPIICSDTYGLQDTIVDNVTGLRHITQDVNSLYEKMKYLVDNPYERINMGIKGREYTEDYFSKEIMAKLWLTYFSNLFFKNKELKQF